MERRVFIAIGSNKGDREANCRRATALIGSSAGVELIARSPLYETEPWGVREQAAFVNSVVEVSTGLTPTELLAELKAIESAMGRTSSPKWHAREIDLDILFYGDEVVEEAGLKVPHPCLHERAFVLAPLADIAPDFIHPVLKKSVREMLSELKDAGWVKRL